MYKLYTRAGSGGFVVEAALNLAGIAFDEIDVPKSEQNSADFLKISPMAQVPVLGLPDGRTMTESAAICILIAERHPQAGLAPKPGDADRADFLRWMVFMSTVLYPAVLRYYYAHRYTADAEGTEVVKLAAVAEMDRAIGILDKTLCGRDWIVGNDFSIADVYALMLFSWHPEIFRLRDQCANLERMCASLRDKPQLAKLGARHEMW